MSDTIFDKIIRREIPAKIAYEDDHVLAFHDVSPQAPIHVLVIPKTKWVRFADLKQVEALALGQYMRSIALVAEQLGLEPSGYRVVFNNGRDGQQTVDYIHAHILGGRGLHWPPG
jgi:histidine triad (HIT) family protein